MVSWSLAKPSNMKFHFSLGITAVLASTKPPVLVLFHLGERASLLSYLYVRLPVLHLRNDRTIRKMFTFAVFQLS